MNAWNGWKYGAAGCVAAALSLVLGGCGEEGVGDGGDGTWAGTVDTLPHGVVHVSNPAEGLWAEGEEWRLVEDLRIGSLDGDGPEVFGSIVGLAVDGGGQIHVLDAQAHEVRTFDAAGEPVRSVGGEGEGPGELRNPSGLALASDGSLWVADPGNRRYTVFDGEGEFLRTYPQEVSSVYPWPGAFDAQGRLVDQASSPVLDDDLRLTLLEPGTGQADSVAIHPFPDEAWEGSANGGRVRYTIPFHPGLMWGVGGDGRLRLGVNEDYRFAVSTSEGDTLMVVERPWDPEPLTDEERESALSMVEMVQDQGLDAQPGDIPDTRPAYSALLGDPEGRTWVARFPHGEPTSRFDVFDSDGRFLGAVESETLLASTPRPVVRDGFVYGVTRDELDIPHVVRLRVDGPKPPSNGR